MAINMETIEKMPAAQKVLIVAGVILLIYGGFYFLWVSKRYEEIKKKEETLDRKLHEVAQGKAVLQEIKKYEQIQADYELQLKDAERKLPKKAEIPELLDTISDLARGNYLVFTNFHPGQTPTAGAGGAYKQISITVNFTGNYHNIATFLVQISKLERIINVSTLSLTPVTKGSHAEKIRADVKLVTYMFGG